jgi:hypothetical protein
LEQKVNYIFRLRLRPMKANWSNEEGSELNRPVECLCVKHDAEVHKSHAPGSQGIWISQAFMGECMLFFLL